MSNVQTYPDGFNGAVPLKKPTAEDAASQTREMGLKVGDTIIGRENWPGSWSEAKIKLVWRGATIAVFEKWSRLNYTEWVDAGEKANWTLSARDWYLIKE